MTNLSAFLILLLPVAFFAGFLTPKFHQCHEALEDGRKLLSVTSDGTTARCKYSTPPGRYEFSPEELRRMARAKERSERVYQTK